MIKTIIFDLDGTLINLNLDFNKLKLKVQNLLQLDEIPTPLLNTIVQYTKNKLSLRRKIWDLIDKLEEESIANLELFPETIPVLKKLKEKDYNLALITLQGRKATNLILYNLAINNLFNLIITRDDSYLRSHQIELVIKALKLSKDQVLMVGDRLNDFNASKKIDVKCILIRRQYNPLDGTTVIKSLAELFKYI